jgi:hypothetical protein
VAAGEALSMLTTLSHASEYLPLALECRTQNQFNRLHIHLENILAPPEFVRLADLARREQLPEQSCNWLKKIAGLSPGLFDQPQAFSRRALSENVLFYQDREREAAGKSLLVGFAGDARRLMLPIAVFLQCFDAHAWDVVLLRKGPNKWPYSKGVEGVSRHLPAALNYVKTSIAAGQYRRIVTLGMSGGGFYAILAAILLDGARGVSIGGALPKTALGFRLRWQLAFHRAFAEREPEFKFVYSADHDRDRRAATAMQSAFGGIPCPVAGVADHNPLAPLLARGALAEFLNELLA